MDKKDKCSILYKLYIYILRGYPRIVRVIRMVRVIRPVVNIDNRDGRRGLHTRLTSRHVVEIIPTVIKRVIERVIINVLLYYSWKRCQ